MKSLFDDTPQTKMVTRLKQIVSSFRNKLYRFIRFRISKRTAIIVGGLVGVIVLVGGGTIAYAGPNEIGFGVETILWLFNTIIFYLAYFFGYLAMKVFGLVVWVASYQGFIDNKAVSQGWYLVRDTMNMFFVVILLVIAFATILRVEKYEIKKMLPAVIKAAILVNFSKLICGIIIDIGQVVMLTFVAGFAQSAGGNLAVGIGIDKIMAAKNSGTEAKGMEEHHYTVILLTAVVLTFVALIVMTVMLAMLVTRIVAIWFYVVISPLAFVMKVVPFTAKYADQWWSKFGWYVAIGPVMSFFLWLSLLTMSDPQGLREGFDPDGVKPSSGDDIVEAGDANTPAILTQDVFTQYVIAIGLLWMSVYVAQEAGGTIGQIASKISSKGLNIGKAGLKLAGSPVTNRLGAMKEGFKARLADNKQRKMAVWKERGGKAGGAAERALDYANIPSKAIKTLVASGKSAVSQVGISKAEGKKGKDVAKDTVKAFFRGGKKELGSIDPVLKITEDQAAQAALKRKAQVGKELNDAQGISTDEQKAELFSDSNATKEQKIAAGMDLGNKGKLTAPQNFQMLDFLKNDRESMKAYKKSVADNQTDLVYLNKDGTYKTDKMYEDIENDKLNVSKLPSKVTSNAKFMEDALDQTVKARGAKAAGEVMVKLVNVGADQAKIVSDFSENLPKEAIKWQKVKDDRNDPAEKKKLLTKTETWDYNRMTPDKQKAYLEARPPVPHQPLASYGLSNKDQERFDLEKDDKKDGYIASMIDAIQGITVKLNDDLEASFNYDRNGDRVDDINKSAFSGEFDDHVQGMTGNQIINLNKIVNENTENRFITNLSQNQVKQVFDSKERGSGTKGNDLMMKQANLLWSLKADYRNMNFKQRAIADKQMIKLEAVLRKEETTPQILSAMTAETETRVTKALAKRV